MVFTRHFLTNGPSPFLLHGQVNDLQNNFNSKTTPNIKRWVPALQVDRKSNDLVHISFVEPKWLIWKFMEISCRSSPLNLKRVFSQLLHYFSDCFFRTVSLGLGQKEYKDSWPWNLWSLKITGKIKSTGFSKEVARRSEFDGPFHPHHDSASTGKCWEIPSRSAGITGGFLRRVWSLNKISAMSIHQWFVNSNSSTALYSIYYQDTIKYMNELRCLIWRLFFCLMMCALSIATQDSSLHSIKLWVSQSGIFDHNVRRSVPVPTAFQRAGIPTSFRFTLHLDHRP